MAAQGRRSVSEASFSILLSAATETANNNIIANITDNIVGSYSMYAIESLLPAASMTGNTVRNMSGNSNAVASVVMSGISASSTSTANVNIFSQNTIHSLSNASGTASNSIYAMDLAMATSANVTGNLVERNFIHSLSMSSTDKTCQLWGIVMRGQGRGTFQNNMIRLGLNADGSSITDGFSIIGIRDIAGATGSYYFNSVYITGTGVASVSNTYAFLSDVVTNTRNFKDNIFWNARSNASGGVANIAISVGGTAPNPPGLSSNYNDLFATGTDGFTGFFNGVLQFTLSDWQTATGQDANSFSANPLFVNPNGNAATVDLHIQAGSPAIGRLLPSPARWQIRF